MLAKRADLGVRLTYPHRLRVELEMLSVGVLLVGDGVADAKSAPAAAADGVCPVAHVLTLGPISHPHRQDFQPSSVPPVAVMTVAVDSWASNPEPWWLDRRVLRRLTCTSP